MEMLNDYEDDADTISIDTLALEERVQQERKKEITQLHSLSKKVSFLHTDLLYYRHPKSAMGAACYDAWKTLVKKVGGTPNGWLDLGHSLGITNDDLNYIKHSVKDDQVDMVLKVFRQNDNATIDKILDALVKQQRYDILKSVEDPLCEIAKYFSKDDSGYHSNSSGQREIVSLKNLPNDLPPALNKNIVFKPGQQSKEPKFQPPEPADSSQANERPILFLTYSYDGLPTVINIQEYVENWVDFDAEVITLNGRRDDLYQNPEKFIRELVEKADLIIPIITPGYLDEINSDDPTDHNIENLDNRYVKFIYNLLTNYYMLTGCLNKKVRSVLPQNTNMTVIKSVSMYPHLLPWTYEKRFDDQFKAFLEYNNSNE